MGAGTYYTHECSRNDNFNGDERSSWIDLDPNYEAEDLSDIAMYAVEDLTHILEAKGYDILPNKYQKAEGFIEAHNGLGKFIFESNYHGDGIVIRLEPHFETTSLDHIEDRRREQLFYANFDKMYDKMQKILLDAGYNLRVATSGYTSAPVTKEDL